MAAPETPPEVVRCQIFIAFRRHTRARTPSRPDRARDDDMPLGVDGDSVAGQS